MCSYSCPPLGFPWRLSSKPDCNPLFVQILTEIDSDTAIREEVAKLEKLVDTLLALSGSTVLEVSLVNVRFLLDCQILLTTS